MLRNLQIMVRVMLIMLVMHYTYINISGRLAVKEDYLIPAFMDNTALEYLIPTGVGAGTCVASLVDFLTLSHNNFIERCRGLTMSQEEMYVPMD